MGDCTRSTEFETSLDYILRSVSRKSDNQNNETDQGFIYVDLFKLVEEDRLFGQGYRNHSLLS